MRKLIALTTLIAAGSALANTSTTTVSTVKKSFADKLSFAYFGELSKTKINEDKVSTPDARFLNYVYANYKNSSTLTTTLVLRMQLRDDRDMNGQGDRFEEWDPRIQVTKSLNGVINKIRATVEVPTSRASIDSDKIARLKLYAYATGKKLDDYNTIGFVANFNKDFYPEANQSVDATSRFYTTQYFTWNTSYFSEAVKPRIDVEMLQSHMAGKSDNSIMAGAGSERILAGTDLVVLGADIYPYVSHDPSQVKAADNLGAGVQIYKSF